MDIANSACGQGEGRGEMDVRLTTALPHNTYMIIIMDYLHCVVTCPLVNVVRK